MTYTEREGKPPFDWRAFLQQDAYSEQELNLAEYRANSWVTCACGNLCVALPRLRGGMPRDDRLARLGDEFACAVASLRVFNGLGGPIVASQRIALDILEKIESRSAKLLSTS